MADEQTRASVVQTVYKWTCLLPVIWCNPVDWKAQKTVCWIVSIYFNKRFNCVEGTSMTRSKCAAKITHHVTDTQVRHELNHWNNTYDLCEQVLYSGRTWFTKSAAFSQGLSIFVWICGLVEPVNIKYVKVTRSNDSDGDDDDWYSRFCWCLSVDVWWHWPQRSFRPCDSAR